MNRLLICPQRARLLVLLLMTMPLMATAKTAPVESLNFYNWSDYIDESTIANFEKESGIAVQYEVYDDVSVANARLANGNSGFDVAVVSLQDLAQPGVGERFLPIDKSRLANYDNLDPVLLELMGRVDRGNAYGVNWLWGSTGLGFNTDKLEKLLGKDFIVDSWDLLFKPELASRLKDCGISMLDRPGEMLPIALAYLGLDPSSRDEEVIRKGQALLASIRPFIRSFNNSEYINELANGDVCLSVGWSGDVFQANERAKEAGRGIRVAYAVPREGAPLWFDMLAIPKNAPHADNAYRFLDFVLRPEVMAGISQYVQYANANRASLPLLDTALRNDPARYPAPARMPRMFVLVPPPPATATLYERLWRELKEH